MVDNQCRICLEYYPLLIDLRTCYYEQLPELSYSEIFLTIVGFVLDDTENSLICRNCKYLLSSAYDLRLRARKSTEFLRSKTIEFVEAKCEAILDIKEEDVESDDNQNKRDASSPEIKDEEPNEGDVSSPDFKDEEPEIKDEAPNDDEQLERKIPVPKSHFDYRCRYCLKLKKYMVQKQRCEIGHIRKNKGLECNYCDYKSNNRYHLKNHLFTHDPNRLKCPECPSVYTARSSLLKHILANHPTEDRPRRAFICQVCGKELRTSINLDAHIARFHQPDDENVRKIICDFCGKRCFLKTEMKNHIETVHLKLQKYQCKFCRIKYKTLLCLKQHIESKHANGDKIICPICGKALKNSMSFYSHQIVHSGNYKYMCAVEGCSATFKHKGSLRSHKRVHEPKMIYACEFCPKKFAHPGSLRNHRYQHTPGMMQQCKFCEKSYTIPFLLKEHEEVVHQGKRYNCTACGCGMTSKNNLRRHIRLHCTQGVKKRG